jgi:hypothetical protein
MALPPLGFQVRLNEVAAKRDIAFATNAKPVCFRTLRPSVSNGSEGKPGNSLSTVAQRT